MVRPVAERLGLVMSHERFEQPANGDGIATATSTINANAYAYATSFADLR